MYELWVKITFLKQKLKGGYEIYCLLENLTVLHEKKIVYNILIWIFKIIMQIYFLIKEKKKINPFLKVLLLLKENF